MSGYEGFSDIERKIISDQIERRLRLRKEFLKLRTDPCKHSQEAGHVFDPALQRWLSMKACQLDYFKPCPKTITKGLAFIAPFFAYGYLMYTMRKKFEMNCRCGQIKYRQRSFKFI